MKIQTRVAAGALLLAGIVVLAVPQINADSYRGAMQSALQQALGRKVQLSSVRFRLLPRPGFTVSNVIVGEDPAVGPEPVAYVTTLRASPRIMALLAGRLEIAAVDLEEASLNITRVDSPAGGVRWNLAALTKPDFLTAFPTIHLHGGRINFKQGPAKSLFYLLDTDVDLWPPGSAADPWTLKVRANPARTDRTARGFGSFLIRGEWYAKSGAATLDVRLERSELGDLITLLNGNDTGIEGAVTGSVHIAGPLRRMGMSGRMTLANLHGWAQAPPGGNEWPLILGGVLDAGTQTVDVTAGGAVRESPLGFRLRVADITGRPRWGVNINVSRFPLAAIPGVARNLGAPIPDNWNMDGLADGVVGYSAGGSIEGGLNLSRTTLTEAGGAPLKIPFAALRFRGSNARLEATPIMNDAGETAVLQGVWDIRSGRVDAALASDGMAIQSLGRQVSVAGIPLFSLATAGTWSGRLRYSNVGPGWAGEVRLKDAVVPFEAFSQPLGIASADAVIQGSKLTVKRLSVTSAGITAQGEYQYEPTASSPHRFRLSLAKIDAAALEGLLTPALQRGNLFSYAVNFGRPPQPDWLRDLRADGSLQVASFEIAGNELTRFRTRVLWNGMAVRFVTVDAALGTAVISGTGTVNLDRRQPAYAFQGHLGSWAWKTGRVDADFAVTTYGTGAGLLARLKATGSFSGSGIDLAPVGRFDSVAGEFDGSFDGTDPTVSLSQLVLKNDGETWQGSAETSGNGQVLLKLSDGTRRIQAAGAIFRGDPFKILP